MENKVKTLRTPETYARYERYRASSDFPKCYLCDALPLKKYKYWKVIENQFPYDEITTMHRMVVISCHKNEDALTNEEMNEFRNIKKELHEEYDMILENTYKRKSIPEHHHLHLLRIKERILNKSTERPRAVFFTSAANTAGKAPP